MSRELRRNRGLRGYRPKQTHQRTTTRRRERGHPRILSETWSQVARLLRAEWSPEQISCWLAAEKTVAISHE